MDKKQMIINWIVLILLFVLFGFIMFSIMNTEIPPKQQVQQQIETDKKQSIDYKHLYDSATAYNSTQQKAINQINQSINKLINENNKNKGRIFTANDSVKLFICDSILRSNGYR